MAMSSPPIISTVEVVGVVTAWNSVPYLNGASTAISANGAERAKKSHSEVVETTRTSAMLSSAQTITTASPTITPRCPWENHGNRRGGKATTRGGEMAR